MHIVSAPASDGATLTIAVVLLFAGVMKIAAGPRSFRESALGVLLSSRIAATGVWMGLSLCEILVALGLFLFRGSQAPRIFAALFFATALVYLVWALRKESDRPCGCFGMSTAGPVSQADVARTALLTSLALVAIPARGTWSPLEASSATWALSALGLLLVVALSPDLREAWHSGRIRVWRYNCATASIPVDSALHLLHESDPWTTMRPYLRTLRHSDHWRAGCWRFFTFDATWENRSATAVFAVRTARRQRAVTGAIVDDTTDAVVLEDTSIRRSHLAGRPVLADLRVRA